MATRNLIVAITSDAKGFSKGFNEAQRSVDKFGRQMDSAQQGTMSKFTGRVQAVSASLGGLAAAAGGALVLGKVVDFAQDSVRAFSDLEESVNAVNVTFGRAAGEILEFGENAAQAVGLSNAQFNQLSVSVGAFLQNVGFSAAEAADETIRLTQRAADLASVFNIDVSDALAKIQSGLRGEAEPLRALGVNLSAAAIEAEALASGLVTSKSEIDQNVKAAAALNLIYEQTAKVQGDFAATSDSLANSQRRIAAEIENTKAEIGEALQPIFLELLQAVEELLPSLKELVPAVGATVEAMKPVIGVLIETTNAIGPLLSALGELGVAYGQVRQEAENLYTSRNLIEASDAFFATLVSKGALPFAIEQVDRLFGLFRDAPEPELDASFLENEARRFADLAPVVRAVAEGVGELDAEWRKATYGAKELDEESQSLLETWEAQIEAAEEVADQAAALSDAWVSSIDDIEDANEDGKRSTQEYLDSIRNSVEDLRSFADSIATFTQAGLDRVSQLFIDAGPAAAGDARQFAENIADAFELEELLEEEADAAIAAAIAPFQTPESFASTLQGFGQSLARFIEAGFSELDLIGTVADQIDRAGNRGQVGDSGRRGSGIRAFASGGIINRGELGLVGENGPELIRPLQSSRIYPTGTAPAGPAINIYQTFERVEGDHVDQDIQRGVLLSGIARHAEVQRI